MNLFKSKVDCLVAENESLKIERQNVLDRQNERNSAIETKLKKLENKAFQNKSEADAAIAEIERKIDKNNQLIKIEIEYANSIGAKMINKEK